MLVASPIAGTRPGKVDLRPAPLLVAMRPLSDKSPSAPEQLDPINAVSQLPAEGSLSVLAIGGIIITVLGGLAILWLSHRRCLQRHARTWHVLLLVEDLSFVRDIISPRDKALVGDEEAALDAASEAVDGKESSRRTPTEGAGKEEVTPEATAAAMNAAAARELEDMRLKREECELRRSRRREQRARREEAAAAAAEQPASSVEESAGLSVTAAVELRRVASAPVENLLPPHSPVARSPPLRPTSPAYSEAQSEAVSEVHHAAWNPAVRPEAFKEAFPLFNPESRPPRKGVEIRVPQRKKQHPPPHFRRLRIPA